MAPDNNVDSVDSGISDMPIQWHIPRPSLAGSSGAGSTCAADARPRGGSNSSQGSSSNHSTHSASSGSLLLSAAHLAKVHSRQQYLIKESAAEAAPHNYRSNLNAYVEGGETRQHRKLRRTDEPNVITIPIPEEGIKGETEERLTGTTQPTDPFWKNVKLGTNKDDCGQSVASSTHFTVVNGFTRHRGKADAASSCCCNSSHQLTVLVISMTILFSACILAAICFVEMRMRRDSAYRYS